MEYEHETQNESFLRISSANSSNMFIHTFLHLNGATRIRMLPTEWLLQSNLREKMDGGKIRLLSWWLIKHWLSMHLDQGKMKWRLVMLNSILIKEITVCRSQQRQISENTDGVTTICYHVHHPVPCRQYYNNAFTQYLSNQTANPWGLSPF